MHKSKIEKTAGFGAVGVVSIITVVVLVGLIAWRIYEVSRSKASTSTAANQNLNSSVNANIANSAPARAALLILQNDAQRKSDLQRLMSQLAIYSSDHQGRVPSGNGGATTQWGGFTQAYLLDSGHVFSDPKTDNVYSVIEQSDPLVRPTLLGSIFVYPDQTCANNALRVDSRSNRIAGLILLEQDGVSCENN